MHLTILAAVIGTVAPKTTKHRVIVRLGGKIPLDASLAHNLHLFALTLEQNLRTSDAWNTLEVKIDHLQNHFPSDIEPDEHESLFTRTREFMMQAASEEVSKLKQRRFDDLAVKRHIENVQKATKILTGPVFTLSPTEQTKSTKRIRR